RPGKGLYTNMNAIRRDETLDNLHSIYVDQWDWERVITPEKRNIQELKFTVQGIVLAICDTLEVVKKKYPRITTELCREVKFITSQELEDMYPDLTSKEREHEICREYKTVFIMQIGDKLLSGEPHDNRAPDYDDWQLNGDLLFYNPVMDNSIEISSMGIRVDPFTLDQQLRKSGCDDRRSLEYHRMLLEGKLPCTIGGGIGQSRLCMLLLGKAHIGEVQSSIWDEETIETCKAAGIALL
ncbi:MAG: aspartate--ammonia ligase, partial [Anaerotignum sp.]|nr:aspartate--ammonia ligase [Anaerotignum sp.]